MSLLDKMEHIAELEGLIDSDEDEDESLLDDSVLDAESSDIVPRMSGTLSPALEEEEEDDEDEEDDDEVFTPEDLGYEWQGGVDEEDLGYEDLGYEDQSQLTGSESMAEDLSDVDAMVSSAAAMRRISSLRASRTGNSYSSAPEGSHEDEELYVEGRAQRRSTFAGPPNGLIREGGMSRRVSSRRQNINLGSISAPPGMNSLNMSSISDSTPPASGSSQGSQAHGSASVLQKIQSNVRRATAMKSRRNTTAVGGDLNSIQQAASKLESGPDSVFAAASVVAHSAATAAKRGHVQFNTDDAVLCMLTLLNVTNPGDDTESFTVSPVNIHGYPPGEGKTEMERQGPYVFVLAFVKFVHFDEDERYYTVVRADNGTEQRADTGRILVFCLSSYYLPFMISYWEPRQRCAGCYWDRLTGAWMIESKLWICGSFVLCLTFVCLIVGLLLG